ncbi:C-C chemokine receptor type 1-like [Nematolebias whitei]|uniref:C-C chemokine receptor type 1-like n=1 Tax=Nematolebias whitei TaxID=451745 RepID=UPI00189A6007|nr:C-C chemokine receptor type 1-like [Nematolebias whitei]
MDQSYSTVATSNFCSPGLPPHSSLDSSRLVPAVILSICFVLGVIGNIAVIILKPNWDHLSSLSQSLILNLAISDLLFLFTLPIVIDSLLYGWRFSLVSCTLLNLVLWCSVHGSHLTVIGLGVQRYLLVVHQQRCQQVPKGLLFVLLWLVAFILSVPSLVFWQLVQNQQWTDCAPHFSSDAQWMALLIIENILCLASFFIVMFSYIHVRRKVNQATFFNNPQTKRLVTSIIEPVQQNQRASDMITTIELS